MTPGSAEWLQLITASKVGTILGLNKYEKPKKLWERMVGLAEPFAGNIATAHGKRYEPESISEYETEEGVIALPGRFLRHASISWLAATPDGFVGADTVLECKCPYSGVIPDEAPPHYYAQVQTACEVSGRPIAHLWYYVPRHASRKLVIERDRSWWADNYDALESFWRCVESKIWKK